MLRAKRRRTRMHDSKGNPIFNTNNATSKQNRYVMKNNYLESLKIKGNGHNKCKKYYTYNDIINRHQQNLKNSALIINFSSHDFTNDQGCAVGLLSALYENTNQLSGKYKFLGNYTYYLDKAINAKDDNNNTVKSIVFMTYVGELGPYGFWGIIGFPFSESQQTFEEAVQYYYEYIIIENGLKLSDFTNVCSVLSHKLGSNDITKYYQSTWNEGTDTKTSITVSMTPDTKHSNADKIKNKMSVKHCNTSNEQNPILGYRKQLVTKHNNQNTKAIQLSLNLTDKSIIDILKQVGLDYFNEIINFSGDYELVNHIEKETNLKDLKFNLAYKKINTKNNNNYEIGYFYEKTPIGNFSFNGWVLRYYNNIANPNIIIDYFYFVDDNDTNRLFVNALDNFSRTTFVIRTKNNDDGIGNKGIFCFIDPNSCNIINNNDNIKLKDNDTSDEWYGIVYDKRINPYNNALQFYVGNLTTTSQKTFPYSNTDITINGNTCLNISVDKLVVDIGNIPKSDFIFNKTGHVYFCDDSVVKDQPLNTIYKDNYAKTCGRFRKENSSLGKFCAYNNVILSKQNTNGIVDASYNYSTSQYLSRPNFMKCNNVYKKSNPRFSTQGAVSGGSRLNRLKYQTIVKSQQKVYENEEDKNISNMVNGVYPSNLYRNTRPIYKQIYSKNVKCKGRSCNGLLQFCPN